MNFTHEKRVTLVRPPETHAGIRTREIGQSEWEQTSETYTLPLTNGEVLDSTEEAAKKAFRVYHQGHRDLDVIDHEDKVIGIRSDC